MAKPLRPDPMATGVHIRHKTDVQLFSFLSANPIHHHSVCPCDSHPWPKSEPPGTAQRAQLPSCPPSLPPSLPHSNSSKQISPKPFNSTPAADSFINVLTFVTQLAFRCQRKRHIPKDTFLASQMGRVPTVLRHTQTSCLCNYSFHTFSVLQGIIPMTVATVAA